MENESESVRVRKALLDEIRKQAQANRRSVVEQISIVIERGLKEPVTS